MVEVPGLLLKEVKQKAGQDVLSRPFMIKGWLICNRASQMAPVVKNLLMQETKEMLVQSLVQEDPLEEGMAALSSILTWKIP